MLIRQYMIPALALLAVGACHHAPPAVAPAPEQTTPPQQSAQPASNDAADRARARADSLRLAQEAAARALASARATLAQPIFFDFDSASVRSDQMSTAEAKVPILSAHPSVTIRVEGNADERGSAEYDIALGMRRAAEAKRLLTERGIDANRIATVSFGKERPLCSAHDESCWHQNRRDDFRITAGDVSSPATISNR